MKTRIQKIMKRLPLMAAILGAGLAMANSKPTHRPITVGQTQTVYYFSFSGSHGQEGTTANWNQVSQADFENSACDDGSAGCMIATTQVTGSGTLRPQSVTVDASSTPVESAYVIQAKNRD